MAARRSSIVIRLGLSLALALVMFVGFPLRASAGPVLVLGFVEEGRPNARIRQSVIQFLQRMGEEVVGTSLSSSDQLCTQSDCLTRLGERHQAQRILGGELIPNDNSYRVLVWLFDRVTEMPNSAETTCTDCNAELLADTVARTAGNVLEVGAAPQQEVQRPRVASQPVQQPTTACRTPYRSFGRGVAIGSLAALTLAGLTTGLVLAGYNGQPYLPEAARSDGASPTYRFGPHTGLALGLTAAPALGLAAAALPWHSLLPGHHRSSVGVCPDATGRRSFGRGIAVGALGSFAISGLVSAFALTAVNGSVYATHPDGSDITYDLKPHYTTASVVGAAMIAGLGLALFIP